MAEIDIQLGTLPSITEEQAGGQGLRGFRSALVRYKEMRVVVMAESNGFIESGAGVRTRFLHESGGWL